MGDSRDGANRPCGRRGFPPLDVPRQGARRMEQGVARGRGVGLDVLEAGRRRSAALRASAEGRLHGERPRRGRCARTRPRGGRVGRDLLRLERPRVAGRLVDGRVRRARHGAHDCPDGDARRTRQAHLRLRRGLVGRRELDSRGEGPAQDGNRRVRRGGRPLSARPPRTAAPGGADAPRGSDWGRRLRNLLFVLFALATVAGTWGELRILARSAARHIRSWGGRTRPGRAFARKTVRNLLRRAGFAGGRTGELRAERRPANLLFGERMRNPCRRQLRPSWI